MNMRKIIAVLSAALLLCAAIPMGALTVVAAPGDVILDIDFNDGTNGGFDRSYNENGYIVFDASTGDWQNTYKGGVNGFQKNVDYVVTFKAKADRNTTMNFKINSDWAYDSAAFTVDVTTEWQEYESTINMAELGWAIVMFSSNAVAADGATYYIDDLKIVEKAEVLEVGVVKNGDFENGSEGWTLNGSASIENGSLKIDNCGQWSEAALANIAVEVGAEYILSWKSQRIEGNGAFMMFILKGDDSNHPTTAGQNWMNNTSADWVESSLTFIAEDANLKLKLSAEVDNPGIILIDDIQLIKVKKPSDDGFIKNGDFETGDAAAWTVYSGEVNADAAKSGDYGLHIQHASGNWNGTAYQDFIVEIGKTYVVTLDAKAISQGQNIQVQNGGAVVASDWFTKTDWTTLSFEFTATATDARINICGGGTNSNEEIYVDNVVVTEKAEQSAESIWETDFNDGDNKFSGGAVVAEGPDGSNCYKWTANGGWSATYTVIKGVDPNKDYSVTMKVKGSVAGNMGVTIQNGDWGSYWNAPAFAVTTEWTDVVYHIPANSIPFAAGNILFKFQDVGVAMDLYVDDIAFVEGLVEKPEPSVYLQNGDFETGELSPWDNLWGGNTVSFVEGKDGGYALSIVSKQWNHVRQTGIAVKANSWYKVTLWAKNTNNMCILVKNGADTDDILNKGISAGDEWTEFTVLFNTGDYTSIIFSLMGGAGTDQYGTFDNIVMEKHEYVITTEDPTCELEGSINYTCETCGDTYTETIPAYHNGQLVHTPAKDAIDCQNPGNIEYYSCPGCYEYFTDAFASEMINPWYIEITVDCVRPEGAADCAIVPCEVCGNDVYGYGEHDALACKGGTCSKCGVEVEGYGCANYDTPACEDGYCYYCGDFIAGFGHENGAWAACVDGECAYGCGLTYPASEDHVDSDADDYCDNCWNHLACIDEDADGWCDLCWSEMPHDCIDEDTDGFCDICWSEMPSAPVEIVYGDANGDGIIDTLDEVLLSQYLAEWDVELDEVAADANGDGIIDTLDEVLLSQYLAEWDVTLGPV